jgi:hypothetical protein
METWKHLRAILLLPFMVTVVIFLTGLPDVKGSLPHAEDG